MMDINRATLMMLPVLCAASSILGFSQETILKPKYKEMERQRGGNRRKKTGGIQKLPSFHLLKAVYRILLHSVFSGTSQLKM